MRRREFITLLGGTAAAWPVAVYAQKGERVRRVGILMNGPATEERYQSYLAAFMQALRSLGWNDGQNIRVDVRWNDGDAMLSRIYAAQLIGLMPDVIVAQATINLTVIQRATSAIPIVFVSIADPVAQGFVANVRQPGGNLTGFSLLEFSLGGKWIDLLKEVAPGMVRVVFMFNPDIDLYSRFYVQAMEAAAPSLGVEVTAAPIRATADIEPVVASLAHAPNGGLVSLVGGFTQMQLSLIAELARRHRLPSIGSTNFANAGGLMEYAPNQSSQFRQAAGYVDRILKGTKPGELPVQAPDRYRFVINLKTAKALGLTVPLPLLGFADEVIE